ncbi:MAG TPA: hypothetical protein VFG79_19760 [Solirubrobacter sp.]|nr:hypothetical protein [Solirubrobacter sp.]
MHHDLESFRNDIHLALIQAGTGEDFLSLVDLIDGYVAVSVQVALDEPPEVPF